MFLREFDLDLPYIENGEKIKEIMKKENCEYYDATKMDYNLNWKDKRRLFRLETRCVTSMYERLFGKMKNEDGWRLLVECVEKITDSRILNFSGVITVQVKFNYEEFHSKNEMEKKISSLILLKEGIEKVANNKGWTIEPFNNVALQIEQANYLNEWTWKKPVVNQDRDYYAEVLCQHNVESMDISIVIKNNEGNLVSQQLIIKELPDEFAYAKHLGRLVWPSNEEVALISQGDKQEWRISLNTE